MGARRNRTWPASFRLLHLLRDRVLGVVGRVRRRRAIGFRIVGLIALSGSSSRSSVSGRMMQRMAEASQPNQQPAVHLSPWTLARGGARFGNPAPGSVHHGYLWDQVAPQDYSQYFPPLDAGSAWGGWAWASGGMLSTPADLNRFARGYASGRLFGPAVQEEQTQFLDDGESDPPGPGENAAGLGLFRYRTRCGTVVGHTGSIPGRIHPVRGLDAERHGAPPPSRSRSSSPRRSCRR